MTTTTRAALWIAASVAVIAHGAAFFIRAPSPPRAAEARERVATAPADAGVRAAAELEALELRLSGLEAQLARVERPSPAARQTDQPSEASSADPTELASDAVDPELAAEQVARLARTLGDAVESEPRDPQWAGWAEEALAEIAARDELAGADLASSRCATTLCQLDLRFASIETRDQALQSFPSLVAWDASGFSRVDERDPLRVAIFVSREGHPLPLPGSAD